MERETVNLINLPQDKEKADRCEGGNEPSGAMKCGNPIK
jgi:hypothetical protein